MWGAASRTCSILLAAFFRSVLKGLEKVGETDQQKDLNHLDHSTIEIDLNTDKSPGELCKLVITQTSEAEKVMNRGITIFTMLFKQKMLASWIYYDPTEIPMLILHAFQYDRSSGQRKKNIQKESSWLLLLLLLLLTTLISFSLNNIRKDISWIVLNNITKIKLLLLLLMGFSYKQQPVVFPEVWVTVTYRYVLKNSSQSQYCCGLNGLNTSLHLQFSQPLFQILWDCSKIFNCDWYH